MKKIFLLSTLLVIGMISLQAQERYGYINLGNLIAQMPEAIAANDSLEVIQATMVAEGQIKAQQFERDAKAFVAKATAGTLTPQQQETQQAALEKRQQEIQNLEQAIVRKVGAKRDQMLAPIVERAQNAISEVAKEKNLLMVFDTSIYGAIMFADESTDIMAMVKEKLGIEE